MRKSTPKRLPARRARDRGVNDELVRLKSAFMAAMADYRKQEYEKAGGTAINFAMRKYWVYYETA